ncbi:MAG: hypothetical protein L6420_03255 [Elusimicrobia bacterium]|nr:hypothetical protein [Elusimicrobiota bacterium]
MKDITFECIDFVGMSKTDIDQAFKRWGDRRAAARDTGRRMLGGHGNGGKFYMRQMFSTSQFITYSGKRLNVFGFNKKKRYGYADGYENKKMSIEDALKFANIPASLVPVAIKNRWRASDVGFTVVIGEVPNKFRISTLAKIYQKLKIHPQSRRLVKHKEIHVLSNSKLPSQKLIPDEIAPRKEFEKLKQIQIPRKIIYEGEEFEFRNNAYPKAYLDLYTSEQPFGRSGEKASLNSIDILGEVGCIGTYRLNELGYLKYSAQAEFVYGECYCPILEDKDDDCIKNDREKLVDVQKTKALRNWIKSKVDELCEKLSDQDKNNRKKADFSKSAQFNEVLNAWKNKFMSKIFAEVFGGPGQGDSIGGFGGGGEASSAGKGGKSKDGKPRSGDEDGGGGAGMNPKKAPRFPRVLLSSYDIDPLSENLNGKVELDPRHHPVHQRPEDTKEGIYWINTSRPLAQRIIEQYHVESTRWREYLLQRYVDIIVKEAIHQKSKKESFLTFEMVDGLMMDVISRIHDAAALDLDSFLFDETFESNIS